MITTTISVITEPGPSRKRPGSFPEDMDVFCGEVTVSINQINIVTGEINSTVVQMTADIAAALALVTAGTTKWVSGTTYLVGQRVWSPANFRTYRRRTAGSAGSTDPSIDSTNWLPTETSEVVNDLGDLGGGIDDIDLAYGTVVSATVSTSAQTFTFSNPPTSGTSGSFTLFLTNGGSQTVTWPNSVKWEAGSAPVLIAAGVDILIFTTNDGGVTWYGFAAGLDMR